MKKTKFIDLSFPITSDMQTYPRYWHPRVGIEKLASHDKEGRETRKIVIGSHTGTHVDAPLHFIPGGMSIDVLPLERLIGPATVTDLSGVGPMHEISAGELENAVGNNPRERLIIRTDWSVNYGTDSYYQSYPSLSRGAAKWLVDEGVKLIAMDVPSPDGPVEGRGTGEDSPNHKLLLSNNVVLVEYLCNLKEITCDVVELIVLPMKIKGSDGSPARCIVIETKD